MTTQPPYADTPTAAPRDRQAMEAPGPAGTPRRPRPRTGCCQHPERHADRDPSGWWRHDLPAAVAAIITTARERASLSKHQAADVAGIRRGYLQLLERGDRAPSVAMAETLADVLTMTGQERATLLEYAVADAGASSEWRAA